MQGFLKTHVAASSSRSYCWEGLCISCSAVLLQLRARFLVTHVTQPIQSSVIFVMVTSDEGGFGFLCTLIPGPVF